MFMSPLLVLVQLSMFKKTNDAVVNVVKFSLFFFVEYTMPMPWLPRLN